MRSFQILELSHKHFSSILFFFFHIISTDSHMQHCFTTWPAMKTVRSGNWTSEETQILELKSPPQQKVIGAESDCVDMLTP